MRHRKQLLAGSSGRYAHSLIQRCGLQEFRRFFIDENCDRRKTAATLWQARREIREEVNSWMANAEADRQWLNSLKLKR